MHPEKDSAHPVFRTEQAGFCLTFREGPARAEMHLCTFLLRVILD
jgi:hypothetical protein